MENASNGSVENTKSVTDAASDAGRKAAAVVGDKAARIQRAVASAVGSAGQMAGEDFEQVSDKAQEMYRQVKDKVTSLEQQLESHVKQQPLSAVLIAMSVGVAVGYLLRGNNK